MQLITLLPENKPPFIAVCDYCLSTLGHQNDQLLFDHPDELFKLDLSIYSGRLILKIKHAGLNIDRQYINVSFSYPHLKKWLELTEDSPLIYFGHTFLQEGVLKYGPGKQNKPWVLKVSKVVFNDVDLYTVLNTIDYRPSKYALSQLKIVE